MADTNLGNSGYVKGAPGNISIPTDPTGRVFPGKPGDPRYPIVDERKRKKKIRPIGGNLQPTPPGRITIPKDPTGRILPDKPGDLSKGPIVKFTPPPPVMNTPGKNVLHPGRRYNFKPQRGKINRYDPYQAHSTTSDELRQAAMSRLRDE